MIKINTEATGHLRGALRLRERVVLLAAIAFLALSQMAAAETQASSGDGGESSSGAVSRSNFM